MKFNTDHRVVCGNGARMAELESNSVDLVVTSPPYPMIKMWDTLFTGSDAAILTALESGMGMEAFELMHKSLDEIWEECFRVLRPGAFLCINIGDATRSLGGEFQLFPNHSRIQMACLKLGFRNLPAILWRKPTNSPTKFMGSGMYPAGAYVTLEHEYILILRKDKPRSKRSPESVIQRRQSALFWEERNQWYSDLWTLTGARQDIQSSRAQSDLRKRSAAFPFDLPYRLIQMYSQIGDVVLDPFWGTGTTSLAAMASGRSSVGYELEYELIEDFERNLPEQIPQLVQVQQSRIRRHRTWTQERQKPLTYINEKLSVPVMTRQEIQMELPKIDGVSERSGETASKKQWVAAHSFLV